MSDRIGVAISTTGDEHRLGFLRDSVDYWSRELPMGSSLFVTVDGDEEATARAAAAVSEYTESVFRSTGRGVAANKNTGLELLMGWAGAEHLFLSDDDVWPKTYTALALHAEDPLLHSMVCWGKHRLVTADQHYAAWSWPRGVVLYQHRSVVERIGGMREAFGPVGGHEHVEYSQRIHNAGLTPVRFPSPAQYATRHARAAQDFWHAEDMARPGENTVALGRRRKEITSISRTKDNWFHINQVMGDSQGSSDFVPYAAVENGRASATLYRAH